MKTADYLAECKSKLNVTSDYKLAKALKISTQLMAKYAKGQSVPGPVVAFRIAEILGDQPAAVVADLEAERAERDGKPEDADYLRGLVRRIAGGAASILLAAGFGGFLNSDANLARPAEASTHYASYRRRGWWGGTLPA